jgi:hypothetical protein
MRFDAEISKNIFLSLLLCQQNATPELAAPYQQHTHKTGRDLLEICRSVTSWHSTLRFYRVFYEFCSSVTSWEKHFEMTQGVL